MIVSAGRARKHARWMFSVLVALWPIRMSGHEVSHRPKLPRGVSGQSSNEHGCLYNYRAPGDQRRNVPTVEELRFDSRARSEARQKLAAMPEDHFVKLVTAQRDEAEKSTQRLRLEMEESWRYYQSEVDFGEKEDWQSQVWIPMPFSAVEQATAVIQRTLLESSDFFRVDGVDERDKGLAGTVWNPLLKLSFEKASFASKFCDAIKMGFATGLSCYLKFRYLPLPSPILDGLELDPTSGAVFPRYKMERRSLLSVETIPPWSVFRDPRSRPREQWSGSYLIHEDYVDRAVLTNSQAAGHYKNIEQVFGGSSGANGQSGSGPSQEAKRRQQSWEPHEFRKPVLASEWYGDVLDENGDVVFPDAVGIVADHKTVIYGPTDNPLWAVDHRTARRKWPLIAFSPLGHPLRFEGWGILRTVTPLAMLFSNLFNLGTDGMNWKVNQPTELNTAILDDDDEEHYPGKLWRKTGEGQLLTPANIGQMETQSVLAWIQFIGQLHQNNAFVTDFILGTPGLRSNITKGEVEIKTAQSMGIFEAIGQNIEKGGADAVELAYDFLSQYTYWGDGSVARMLGLSPAQAAYLAMMDTVTRTRELSGQFNYLFSGITVALQKSQMLGRLMQAATLAAQGMYAGYTNPSEVLAAIIDALGVREKIQVQQEPMIPISRISQILGGMDGAPGNRVGLPMRAPTMRELQPTPTEMSTAVG